MPTPPVSFPNHVKHLTPIAWLLLNGLILTGNPWGMAFGGEPIRILSGPIEGTASRNDAIEVFKGIPYATPPLRELRWRPPQPVKQWTDVRVCDKFGPRSLQKNERPGQSEDCLYLNVWTNRKRGQSKRPVMVWIHGGGFTQGSGHSEGYDGTELAKRGVVVVTINYRLGAFGFMTHPALSAESPHSSSGNYAILDQIAALQWVRENIASFGGDPENVTIFGESAGGTSVYLLTATPLAKGLFHRAILQSPWLDPIIFRDLKTPNENGPSAEAVGVKAVQRLLEGDSEAVLEKLRALPASTIVKQIRDRWPVTTDGWVFPKDPHQIYADGEQNPVPAMVGTNRDEGTMFATKRAFGGTLPNYRTLMVERYGAGGVKVADYYSGEFEKVKDELYRVAVQQITDTWFVQPSRSFARSMDRQGTPIYMYHFTKSVWGWMGAAHAAEIKYVFGNLKDPNPSDVALTKAFMDYWVEFAKTGNPNLDNRVDWPLYTVSEDQHLVMDDAIVVGSGLRSQACDLFDRILEEQRKTQSPPSQD